MNKRLAAGILAAASTVSVLGVTAPAAQASPIPCGTYPPGLVYALTIVPASARVRIGSIITTRGTLRRGGHACQGFPMGVYAKEADVSFYHLYDDGTTSSTGSVYSRIQANQTVRVFYNLKLNDTQSVRSSTTELIAS